MKVWPGATSANLSPPVAYPGNSQKMPMYERSRKTIEKKQGQVSGVGSQDLRTCAICRPWIFGGKSSHNEGSSGYIDENKQGQLSGVGCHVFWTVCHELTSERPVVRPTQHLPSPRGEGGPRRALSPAGADG